MIDSIACIELLCPAESRMEKWKPKPDFAVNVKQETPSEDMIFLY